MNLARDAKMSVMYSVSEIGDGFDKRGRAVDGYSMPRLGIFVWDLGEARAFNVAMLMEDLREGQHVEEFALDVWDGAGPVTDRDLLGQTGWRETAKGTAIGWKKLLRFPTVRADKVRVRILRARGEVPPFIRSGSFGLYWDPGR